ncbi:hypothetical protein H072_6975 [Dactylellina haptotyla CBS 200.50]|uniref:Glycosyl transferase CAP10 domain-containing protein n=1 Tax=Dactylellina haptotyla (strain CBS 200.50) TaxID=1284197 RepID=S8ADT7_DACHA|nr:hypothetical protein H072_6975 [Dactylellina haptotyla CBS 200.50]
MAATFSARPQPLFILLAAIGSFAFLLSILHISKFDVTSNEFRFGRKPSLIDNHPIAGLMKIQFDKYERYRSSQSTTFQQVVQKYRAKYGRQPPPKFDEWFKFAKRRDCANFDDFDRIMDDLRPFWGVEPAVIRAQIKALDSDESKVAILKIRDGKILPPPSPRPEIWTWRADVFTNMLEVIADYLPDLDIAMNSLDEPRVVVPWEDIQANLAIEAKNRSLIPGTVNGFSRIDWDGETKQNIDLGFFGCAGKSFMDLAAKSCPPDSYARHPEFDIKQVERRFKELTGGFIHNYNLTTDLCTMGPMISHLHGFLFSSSALVVTQMLVPIFGECKVNVNNDIVFPANKYYDAGDAAFAYDDVNDVPWSKKEDVAFWRGVTSDGTQNNETWHNLGRHRFVAITNATLLENTPATIMNALDPVNKTRNYEPATFHPASFAQNKTDTAFNKIVWCVPDCSYILDKINVKPGINFRDIFRYKYLPDLDGHSFSGRWPAFLKSRSLGLKATIFKEWHDQRLFEWVHFVPMDYRFNDLYAILTYFMGFKGSEEGGRDIYVPQHDWEAEEIAKRGREWAEQVLRKEDIEIYMLRLMLEYARVLDDKRENIGYSGDGSEVDAEVSIWVKRGGPY